MLSIFIHPMEAESQNSHLCSAWKKAKNEICVLMKSLFMIMMLDLVIHNRNLIEQRHTSTNMKWAFIISSGKKFIIIAEATISAIHLVSQFKRKQHFAHPLTYTLHRHSSVRRTEMMLVLNGILFTFLKNKLFHIIRKWVFILR